MLIICLAILVFVAIVTVFALFCLVSPTIKYDREINDKEQEKFLEQCRKVHISEDQKERRNENSKCE